MSHHPDQEPDQARRRGLASALLLPLLLPALARAATAAAGKADKASATGPLIEVWKDPSCGCCHDWIRHVQAAGFRTRVNDTGNDMARALAGIPRRLGSCHTGKVAGYAIEGHVPAADIRRLLAEKPRGVGLAVPGMPIGSPGMDGPEYGGKQDRYEVLLVQADGSTRVWSRHG